MSNDKTVILYPGQGSQKPGMGREFFEPGNWCDKMWSEANEILGYNLKEIIFEGSKEKLKDTKITQPAVYMTEMIIYRALTQKGIKPDAVAGHSLGEYGAVVTSGALSWQDGLKLVNFRGEVFARAAENNPGGMVVVIGMEEEKLEEVLSDIKGIAEIVNYNSPGQLVVSVQRNILKDTVKIIKEAGARLVKELEVSGGFHSPLMDDAVPEMSKKIESFNIKNPRIKFYSNYTGQVVNSAKDIKKVLIKQVNSPVRWISIVNNIYEDIGEGLYIEAGPGKVLKGLVRRINRKIKLKGVSSPGELQKIDTGG
ncbi:MAG: ACP S-malonyltransferase [Elusimicrobiota bacterium]